MIEAAADAMRHFAAIAAFLHFRFRRFLLFFLRCCHAHDDFATLPLAATLILPLLP